MKVHRMSPEVRQNLPNTPITNNDTVKSEKTRSESELLTVAKDFSSLFFDTVLQNMRKSVMKSNFMGGGHAEEMYQGMLDSEYAKMIAKQDQTGPAKMIADQLTKISSKNLTSANKVKQNHALDAYRMTKPTLK